MSTSPKLNAKIAFGNIENIQNAIDNNILDERDLIISGLKELPSLYILDDNKQPKKLRSYIDVFENITTANKWLNDVHTKVLDGQPIAVLASNKLRYNLYLVRVTEDSYGLTPVSDMAQIDEITEHINNVDNPHKVTYQQVGLTPMTDEEVKDIVNIVYSSTPKV